MWDGGVMPNSKQNNCERDQLFAIDQAHLLYLA